MRKDTFIEYHTCKLDSPVRIENPNRFKLMLALALEIKAGSWRMEETGGLVTEEGDKVTYSMIKDIINIPPYTVSKILRDLRISRKLGFYGGKTAREKTLCKLNRLVFMAFEMRNDVFFREIYEHYWDDDFLEEAKKCGLDPEDEEQLDRFSLQNRSNLKQKYGIVELADWYKDSFPFCSRQTMKRDLDMLNEIGCQIRFMPETREYRVVNPWQGEFI